MKRLFSKKWHRIPVAIVSALLVSVLVGGVVFAVGYGFFTTNIWTTVEEAIFPSFGWSDDLDPYMIGDGVVSDVEGPVNPYFALERTLPTGANLYTTGPITFNFAISAMVDPNNSERTIDQSEFCVGEEIVIPINLRNRSDVNLLVAVTGVVVPPGLTLQYAFETNTTGALYKATGTWADLSGFTTTLAAQGGAGGSAEAGAQVLFIKVGALGNCPPGAQLINFTLTRDSTS